MGIVYLVTNTINNMQYVGQTRKTLVKRWQQHVKRAKTLDTHLANAMHKYGESAFAVEVLADCADEGIDELEQLWIVLLDTHTPNGYNLDSGGRDGYIHGESTRRKISASLLGNTNSLGRPRSVISKANMRAAQLGKKQSEETIAKRSAALKSRVFSQESKDKMSTAMQGNKNSLGHKHTEETRQKMRDAAQRKRDAKKAQPE